MKRAIYNGLTLFVLFAFSPVSHAEESALALISIGGSQQKALGVTSKVAETVDSAWGTPYPAKIIVPNAQLRVVGAPLRGLLETLLVAEGEEVKKGQVLAIIHSPSLLEQQSKYLEALTDLNFAQAEKKRDEKLSKDGVIAKRNFLESNTKYIQAKTRVEQYRQTLELSGMRQSVLVALKNTHKLSPSLNITAPLSGVVLEQLVTPGSQLDALEPIYKIGHLSPLWLEIHVPLDQLGDVQQGTKIKITQSNIIGDVITVGRMVHGTDQGVLIRAEILTDAEKLRPGQFVQAQIAQSGASYKLALRIPRSALVRNEGKTWVFIAKPTGFLPVAINMIKEEANSLVIGGNLSADDHVVTTGTAALKAAWLEGVE